MESTGIYWKPVWKQLLLWDTAHADCTRARHSQRFPLLVRPLGRLRLSPDGKSILYPALRRSSSLWMMDGFDGLNWSERLRETLPW
jgi:hypothetical protein